MAGTDYTMETIDLEKENQLLLNVCAPGDTFTIRLLTGSAEIFGSELQINKDYEFSYFSSVSVFTWHGCTLQIKKQGSNYSNYRKKTSSQIPKMRDLHEHLKRIRTNVDLNGSDCPIILVTGPMDVGKSTLCRFLLNYAAKEGRTPIFVDLDVGQSSLSITGTVGVLTVDEPSNVYGKFNEQSLSVYYFGYKSPGHNMTLYKRLVEKVGKTVKTRIKKHRRRISEVLIDTCGWVENGGYSLIKYIVDMLNVNTVLVLSESALYSRLNNDLSRRTDIIYIDKFKDVVCRNQSVRRDNRDTCVSEYFYGSSSQQQLYTIKVNFSDLQIFKANSDRTYGTENIVYVSIEPNILYQVFGLSYAEHVENIPFTSVYGFVSIVEVDMDSKIVTVLSPHPGPLPTNYLLMGEITLTQ